MKLFSRKVLKLIFINYMIFVTIIVSIEIIGQIGYRFIKGKYVFEEQETIFREHPYLSVSPKINSKIINNSLEKEVSSDKEGFRIVGNENMSFETPLKIACLGGSTTFGTGVTDADSWPYILQQKLGTACKIFNLGVPGYSTLEAMIQLPTTVQHINPDIVIIYQGWNDINKYHSTEQSYDYYYHGMEQKKRLRVTYEKEEYFLRKFFFYKAYLKILFLREKKSSLNSEANNLPVYHSNDPFIDQIYVQNLKTIEALCQHIGVKAIYVPQVLDLHFYKTTKRKSQPWSPNIANSSMPDLIHHFNRILSETINPAPFSVVLDSMLLKHNWQPKHFVDEGHFSREGGELFTEILIREGIRPFFPSDTLK